LVSTFCVTDQEKIHPDHDIVVEGRNHTIKCLLKGNIVWHHQDKTKLPDNVIKFKNTLIIIEAYMKNYGDYDCIGYSKARGELSARSTVYIEGRWVWNNCHEDMNKKSDL